VHYSERYKFFSDEGSFYDKSQRKVIKESKPS